MMIVEMSGCRYGKFDKVGDYSRVRVTSIEKYGIYPVSNIELNRLAVPLLYVYNIYIYS